MMAAFGVLVVALGLTPLWPVFQTPEFVVTVVAGVVGGRGGHCPWVLCWSLP